MTLQFSRFICSLLPVQQICIQCPWYTRHRTRGSGDLDLVREINKLVNKYIVESNGRGDIGYREKTQNPD